ncbi:DUF2141 domain-containing protein [Roseospira visakhapatnamensis]|uniref:Uncharacterized protein (DUF2141 family) n=1 Tax=Roseospira visakhapatnamensis TaxID=390880 RepID=A0A7W6W8K8_9PROT|nr:DUF2141 domain-containing protein [Roseospira visakhapatnamensis]MBB4264933.1 uncharacterized protein (DUF2141 family) [Roseospira visakhapatnamensis]
MSSGGHGRWTLFAHQGTGRLAKRGGAALLVAGLLTGAVAAARGETSIPPPDRAEAPDLAVLDLTITGLRDGNGTVFLAIYDRPETFPEPQGMRTRLRAEVTGGSVSVTVPDLPPGRYAVAAFHDQNGNGAFDRGLFGVPLEGFGFTRDASVFPVGPAFDDAAVTVAPPRTQARVRMRYGL